MVKTKEKKYLDEKDYRYMTDESDGEHDGKTIKETHRPSIICSCHFYLEPQLIALSEIQNCMQLMKIKLN